MVIFTCEHCNKEISVENPDLLICSGSCKRAFHARCVNVSASCYNKMSHKTKQKWKCMHCPEEKAEESGKPLDLTTVNANSKILSGENRMKACDSARNNEVLQSSEDEPRRLVAKDQGLIDTKDFSESLCAQYKESLMKLASLENQVREQVRKLIEYSYEVHEMKKQTYMISQNFRNNRIEIHGLNLHNTFLTCEIKRKIFELSKCFEINCFSEDDIDIVYVRPSKNVSPPPIVVQFKSRSIRNKWMANRKKVVRNSDLQGGLTNFRIYINENLSSYFRSLWYEARVLAKQKGYKFVWVKDGKLYIRENEFTPSKRICSKEDLAQFGEGSLKS